MSTIWELDMGYLESLGKELRGYIKDDEVTVLPQLRTQYLAELNAVIEKMVSSSAKTDQMEALVKVCQHIATTVNTSRYHRLSQCIERIHSLVNKLRHQQNADSQPLNADALFYSRKTMALRSQDTTSTTVKQVRCLSLTSKVTYPFPKRLMLWVHCLNINAIHERPTCWTVLLIYLNAPSQITF